MTQPHDDPVLSNSRREAIAIALAWIAATASTCGLSYWLGYQRPGQSLGPDDLRPIFGIPLWFFVGVLGPWLACTLWTWWFVGFRMAEDDLGTDHTAELASDIREEGGHDHG